MRREKADGQGETPVWCAGGTRRLWAAAAAAPAAPAGWVPRSLHPRGGRGRVRKGGARQPEGPAVEGAGSALLTHLGVVSQAPTVCQVRSWVLGT